MKLDHNKCLTLAISYSSDLIQNGGKAESRTRIKKESTVLHAN